MQPTFVPASGIGIGVSVAVFRGPLVLLAERGKEPFLGWWSLPGGRLEAGESIAEAAARELGEETGLAAELRFVEWFEAVRPDKSGGFVIAVHAANVGRVEPVAGDDATAVMWARIDKLKGLKMTPGTAAAIQRAYAIIQQQSLRAAQADVEIAVQKQ